ncbi:MAG TPA: hypothetical protein ENG03_05010 [Thioploca sp.]|nr:MAG: hypothetical protein DRR19_04655 [Gammaproteobacteria bacterium]HDN26445.1 hypothetical protein [Thioploca sp.]
MKLNNWDYTWQNILNGVIIYSVGDSIAALILDDFSISRWLGMMLVGGTFYALEVPNYFRWIDSKTANGGNLLDSVKRTMLAMLYFNPVWIARHLFFIHLFSGNGHQMSWTLITVSIWSFVVNIPISLLGNHIIQNKLPYHWRFFGSAVFSGLLAIYYAFSEDFFG